MANHVQEAFARAAGRGGPLFRSFTAYRAAGVTDDLGRPLPNVVDLWFSAPGALQWKDVDAQDRADPHLGLGVLTVFLDWPGGAPAPDFVRDEETGNWLLVLSGMDADALRASFRLQVKKWNEDPPEIYGPNWVQPTTPSRAGYQW